MALQRISVTFDDEYNLNPCVDLTLSYLCHYYFPSCNLATGEITPVCSSSCSLLRFNQDCATLTAVVNKELGQEIVVIEDAQSCSQTYYSYVDIAPVSGNCLLIEGQCMMGDRKFYTT